MKESFKLNFYSTCKTILIALILAFIIKNFIFNFAYVRGISMEPTLQENNFLFTIVPKKYFLKRGDIVLIKSPLENKKYIKRLIALPGDVLDITDGKIFLNGKKLSEKYISDDFTDSINYSHIKLKNDEYFVLGDNRRLGGSIDSRTFGPVNKKSIKSVAVFRLFPLNKIGKLEVVK